MALRTLVNGKTRKGVLVFSHLLGYTDIVRTSLSKKDFYGSFFWGGWLERQKMKTTFVNYLKIHAF